MREDDKPSMKTLTLPVFAMAFMIHTAFAADPFQPARKLVANTYNSGFPEGHDTWNSMGSGSDGRIYYVLSSERHDIGGKMFVFDPKTQRITCLGDLTEMCGEKDKKTIVQGKSHVPFVEVGG